MNFPLIANNTARDSFLNSYKSGRMPHAIIIEGESGSGKTEFAKFIAKTVFCESENKPCGVCKSCNLAEVGTHLDLHIVTPEETKKNIKVDQIRDLIFRAYQKPGVSNTNLFIIDRAETLNASAQNAILKVLEEPPTSSIFIFLTTSITNLLPTVISRCIVYSLNIPTANETAELLKTKNLCDSETAYQVAKEAGGNVKTALLLLEKGKSDGITALAEEYFNAILKRNLYSLLLIPNGISGNRALTEEFITELKNIMLGKLKTNIHDKKQTKMLLQLIKITDSLFESLNTNVHISLLFSHMAYSYVEIS